MKTGPVGNQRGFTLLEVVLAIGLLAMLVGMIFALASQNIALGNAVVSDENRVSEEGALFSLLEKRLSSLPGNARLQLISEDSGEQYLSELTIQGVPLSFSWGGSQMVAEAVQLTTERRRDGFLDIVLKYYEHEILSETTEVGETGAGMVDQEPFATVVLMEDVYIFEWKVLDGRTLEWDYQWDLAGRQPLQLELAYQRDLYPQPPAPLRHIFWITPKQDPAVMMRQFQQGGIGGGGGGPGDGDDGDGDGDGPGGDGPGGGPPGGGGRGGRGGQGGPPPGMQGGGGR